MQTAIALALIRLGNISDRSRPGTGPAPKENVKTNLSQKKKIIIRSRIKVLNWSPTGKEVPIMTKSASNYL